MKEFLDDSEQSQGDVSFYRDPANLEHYYKLTY